MEKIRRWNAKSFIIELDDKDVETDMCLMSEEWNEICTVWAKEVKEKDGKFHHIIKIESELSKLLWDEDEDKKYKYELRIENEPFEEGDLLIIKKSDDNKTEDESEETED